MRTMEGCRSPVTTRGGVGIPAVRHMSATLSPRRQSSSTHGDTEGLDTGSGDAERHCWLFRVEWMRRAKNSGE